VIIIMERGATEEQVESVIEKLVNLEFSVHRSTGAVHTVLGGVGPNEDIDPEEFEIMPGVKECRRVIAPYKLASRAFRSEGTVVHAGSASIGGPEIAVFAGPSSVENEQQIERSAEAVARAGAKFLRAGAFKQRMSPYVFQGLNEKSLRMLRDAAERNGLRTMSEIVESSQAPMMEQYVDILVVGSRNMQNYNLLSELGKLRRPVLLKRGIAATVEEWLVSAEYILSGGNYDVILCERGIRTFETVSPCTLDISSIPAVKRLSHLPVCVDPSRGAGRRDKVAPLALASIAAGADGVLIDVHPDADSGVGDGAQALSPAQFEELMAQIQAVAAAVGRSVSR
jgi:3-deoxy-7-phosphoheptulonate synthase